MSSLMKKSMEFQSFDGKENVSARCWRPDRYRHLFEALSTEESMIARGAGLSYCAAGAHHSGRVILSQAFNRVLDFDPVGGRITVESGMTVGALFNFLAPQGYSFAVLPGYPTITLGGCLAFNVHGKNQYRDGCFGEQLEQFRLFHPDSGEQVCSRSENQSLFELTLGGMGLTGFVTDMTLRVTPAAGGRVRASVERVSNLIEAATRMRTLSDTAETLYAWNDLNLRGKRFGEGLVHVATTEPGQSDPGRVRFRRLAVRARRFAPPLWSLDSAVRAMTRVYGLLGRTQTGERMQQVSKTTFPINGKEAYYALFGRAGFREYQCLIPHDDWSSFVTELQAWIERGNIPVTLGSLKLFRGSPRYLRFTGEGVCLALDVPARRGSLVWFEQLDELVIRHRGVVNLSKDSRLSHKTVAACYAGYDDFRKDLLAYDPHRRFRSVLRERLDV